MTSRAEEPETEDDTEPPPRRFAGFLLLASSLPIVALAVSVLTGLGLVRNLASLPAVVGGLALIVLPVLGLRVLVSGSSRWPAAIGGSAWLWSLVILLSMPFYFPGERAEAGRVGVRYLASALGENARGPVAAVADQMLRLLGSEPESLPKAAPLSLAEAEAEAEAAVRTRREERVHSASAGEVVVSYEGDGQIMRIPVFLDGPRYGDEFSMIFDTGATYTTLNREALELLEVEVPADAPMAVLRTANGEIEAPLVLLDAAWLGDAAVEWVTVAVCDPCAADDVFGLLGLNVSGQFQIALDHEARAIRLTAPEGTAERRLDVAQWVRLSSRIRRWRDGRVEVEVILDNSAHVEISEATALVTCVTERFEVPLEAIPAHDTKSSRMSLPRETDCSEYTLELASAKWRLDRF